MHPDLDHSDVANIFSKIPPPLAAAFSRFPRKLFLAGGYIRGGISREPAKDIDLFVDSSETLRSFLSSFGEGVKWFRGRNTFYTPSLRVPVQVAHSLFYGSPAALFEGADFTIAQACIWHDGTSLKSASHADFYRDLAAKRLRYLSPPGDPLDELVRALKYIQRGYTLDHVQLALILARIHAAGELTGLADQLAAYYPPQSPLPGQSPAA